MIQSFLLHSSEIDEPELALKEITEQLAALPLKKNSVGILACHYDYITNNCTVDIAKALPFSLVGTTSFYQATPEKTGLFELTITVLTSDDACFSVACGDLTPGEIPEDTVRRVYTQALDEFGEKPAVVFNFLSLDGPLTGDEHLRIIGETSAGVPCFGSVTMGDDQSSANTYVICGDTVTQTGFALLLVGGNVNAQFFYGHCKEDQMLEMTATVTEADGAQVKTLNGKPAVDFLRHSGLALKDSHRDIPSSIPFLFKPAGESVFIARTLASYNPDGTLNFFGEVPNNAMLRMGNETPEDVLEISKDVIKHVVTSCPDSALLLICSCVGRYVSLGLEPAVEMDYVVKTVPPGIMYLGYYVGGEICPVLTSKGLANYFHNHSFIVCALK